MKINYKSFLLFFILLSVSIFFNRCLLAGNLSSEKKYDYWPTGGWQTSTPEEQGMDSAVLADMLDFISKKKFAIDSITIVRNGYIVTDAYLNPLFKPGDKHILHSCTKSITSALMGIGIEKGLIKGVDQRVVDFFPEKTFANMNDEKKAITVEHLLTMSHGIRAMDSFLYRWQGLIKMRKQEDWVQFILDQPMDQAPGQSFDYSNMSSFLLSAIINKQADTSTLNFAFEYLFEPLGISDVVWPQSPKGIHTGWGGMWLTPHDMAKIGWLYLNNGKWENRQVVPAQWVKDSIKKYTYPKAVRKVYGKDGKVLFSKSVWVWLAYRLGWSIGDGYGYQWWIDESGIYSAIGYAGQYILIVPHKNLVAVFTSVLGEKELAWPGRLAKKYIIPSVLSDKSLAKNDKAFKRLTSQSIPDNEPVIPAKAIYLPEMALNISGRNYTFDSNPRGYQNFEITFDQESDTAIVKYVIRNRPFSRKIGLDDTYRVNELRNGKIAMKGCWTDPETFLLSYNRIGDTIRGKASISFKGNRIDYSVADIRRGKFKLTGLTTKK
ncbi:MAG: serine hydrolase [Desulfobacteraceae bacterium]|nr:serine hydrolase [Desulfobacteraceae bacterium]